MTNIVQNVLPLLFWPLLLLILLSACVSRQPSKSMEVSTSREALPLIVSIADRIQVCWFKGKNPAFKSFRLANEVNSYAGRPRLLIVPKNKPTGLPALVVEAERINGSTRLQAFGPLLSANGGAAIASELRNWISGKTACAMSKPGKN